MLAIFPDAQALAVHLNVDLCQITRTYEAATGLTISTELSIVRPKVAHRHAATLGCESSQNDYGFRVGRSFPGTSGVPTT